MWKFWKILKDNKNKIGFKNGIFGISIVCLKKNIISWVKKVLK